MIGAILIEQMNQKQIKHTAFLLLLSFLVVLGNGCDGPKCDNERLDKIDFAWKEMSNQERLLLLEKYHGDYPNCPKGTFLLAEQYWGLAIDSPAVAFFNQAIQQNQDDCVLLTNSYYGRANSNMGIENWLEAIDDFGKCYEMSKHCAGTRGDLGLFLNRAICWERIGRNDSAFKDLQLVLNHDHPMTLLTAKYSIGRLSYIDGKYLQAIGYLNELLEEEVDEAAFYYRGLSKLAIGDTIGGCLDLKESIRNSRVRSDSAAYMACGLLN